MEEISREKLFELMPYLKWKQKTMTSLISLYNKYSDVRWIYYFNNAPQSKNIRDQQNSNYKMKNNNNSRRILSTSVDNNFNVFIREHEQIDSIFIWIL
jgi:hypothetical protein